MSTLAAGEPPAKTSARALTVRPALPDDAAALDALEQQLFSVENYPLSRRAFRYHIRHNLLLVVRTQEGELAGYVLALVRRKTPKIYSLGVAPAFRQRGIASLLLQRLTELLAERGFAHVTLEVRRDSGAITLYRRFGFQTVKTLKAFYRDGCDAYLMRRDISQTPKQYC